MKLNLHIDIPSNRFYVFIIGFIFLIINCFMVNAQSMVKTKTMVNGQSLLNTQRILNAGNVSKAQSVPIAESVTIVQNLNFGNLIPYGMGGTIYVMPDYSFNKTGEIIMKSIPTPACLDLYVAVGKFVQMTYVKEVTLVGDHGGTMKLALSDFSPGGIRSFTTITTPSRVNIGGTLTIGPPSANPVGKYSGSLQVYFTINN